MVYCSCLREMKKRVGRYPKSHAAIRSVGRKVVLANYAFSYLVIKKGGQGLGCANSLFVVSICLDHWAFIRAADILSPRSSLYLGRSRQ